MTDQELKDNIISKYTQKYGNSYGDLEEYTEYVDDMNRAELEFENTLIPEVE